MTIEELREQIEMISLRELKKRWLELWVAIGETGAEKDDRNKVADLLLGRLEKAKVDIRRCGGVSHEGQPERVASPGGKSEQEEPD